MKVILQKDIPNLGDAGDVKNVADGYARNFLLPKNLVIKYNESSKKAIDHQKHLIKVKKDKRRKESEKIADAFKNVVVTIKTKVGEDDKLFGSVTSLDISRKLVEAGYEIDKRRIHIDETIKTLGEHTVSVKLEEGLTAPLKVVVEKE
ncbi:MAG TPA: 50S ribosomal protein L9 [Spirochaetota bacterium]|nr:50S ribosomal protein L9 [Spirochaetota bacterium]